MGLYILKIMSDLKTKNKREWCYKNSDNINVTKSHKYLPTTSFFL